MLPTCLNVLELSIMGGQKPEHVLQHDSSGTVMAYVLQDLEHYDPTLVAEAAMDTKRREGLTREPGTQQVDPFHVRDGAVKDIIIQCERRAVDVPQQRLLLHVLFGGELQSEAYAR